VSSISSTEDVHIVLPLHVGMVAGCIQSEGSVSSVRWTWSLKYLWPHKTSSYVQCDWS